MANAAVTTKNGNFIQVKYTGTTGDDWNYKTDGGFRSYIKVKSIEWLPSTTNDIMVINDEGLNGASIFHQKASSITATKIKRFGNGTWMKPYIDISDCTIGTPTGTKVIFELA